VVWPLPDPRYLRGVRRLLIVPALLLVGAGCGGGDSGGKSVELEDSLLSMLRAAPDTEEIRSQPLFYNNFDRLRAGEEADSFDEDISLLVERSSESVGVPRAFGGGIGLPEFRDLAGFDTREIGAFLDFGTPGNGDQVSVIIGDFEAEAIEKGLRSSPGGEELVTETADGVTYLSLGVEGELDIEAMSAVRDMGQSLRIAVNGRVMYWNRNRAVVDACIAAVEDDGPSLADDSAYSSVATVLDAAAIVTALLVTPGSGQDWTLAGVGELFQGETSTLTIALQYPDAARAASAVEALGAMIETGQSDVSGVRWADVLTATDIHSEGSLMIATITSLDPGVAYGLVFRQENLLDV
jgi:hypothetical protein